MGPAVYCSVLSQDQLVRKMFKIVLSVFVSLLVLEQVSGKQCFDCMWTSNEGDTCGDFNDSTKKCNVADGVSCLKTSAKADGEKASVHTCDMAGLCSGQKNECKKQSAMGVTAKVCCCDGELCNSGSFLYGSVLVVFSALLAHWV